MEAQHGPPPPLTDSADSSSTGAYVLRDLIRDVPLSADGDDSSVYITCVDAWNGNLYIGTSAGELLHFVSIPPDPNDESREPAWIIASRLQPPFSTEQEAPDRGVKQILILPDAGKACVLCNATLTFYTLPELSPAFGGKIKQAGCNWVGGLNLDEVGQDHDGNGTVVVICLRQRLRLIRIGEEARKIRDIELGGVGALQRRGNLACVADGTSYSLLDVVNQRKNELFPISSTSEPEPEPQRKSLEIPAANPRGASRSFSSQTPTRLGRHERNISLGAEPKNTDRLRVGSSSPWPARASSKALLSPTEPSSRAGSPVKSDAGSDGVPLPLSKDKSITSRPLVPFIASPTSTEFLLVTGTLSDEPGVGMFVNLDGDVVRGTIEFSSYPHSLVLDGGTDAFDGGMTGQDDREGYALALVQRKAHGESRIELEIQRWDADAGEAHTTKHGLAIAPGSDSPADSGVGLWTATSFSELSVPDISRSLRLRRLRLGATEVEADDAENKRNAEEDAFANRFAQVQAKVLLYSADKVQWAVRNSLLSRLDTRLAQAVTNDGKLVIDTMKVQSVMNEIRGQEPHSELEFLTLTYIRQKASLLLFGNLLVITASGVIAYERDKRAAGEALVDGEIDPRSILSLVSPLSDEVKEGPDGIWLSQGLRDTIDMLRNAIGSTDVVPDTHGPYGDNLLQVIKRYLLVWRKKKGFGSIADETHVFHTIDATLLHVLLLLDQNSPRGPATGGSVRAELNDLVDNGLDCFDRAVELLLHFDRPFVLSRLYQSRKMVSQVLATWRRILDGEHDAGGEMVEGEQDLRRYLSKIRDPALVSEYGAYLAARNPALGVQIFADDTSRVKFTPAETVALLKEKAPNAVKYYLEHLVFGKKHTHYVNDLISFYLSTVLAELESSATATSTLKESYTTYRALRPPKPTYRQFITDNAVDAEWWHNRMRLLQLLSGSEYDVHALGARLAPYSDALVPEMIILNSREGKHEEALHSLVHSLGDYDTAIRYCLLGGSSIFSPSTPASTSSRLPSHSQQSLLFSLLLLSFLNVSDPSERLERTSELLERFGGWFNLEDVLSLIPENWSVQLLGGFLVGRLRGLVRERNESGVVRALSGAQNLRVSAGVAEKVGEAGGVWVVDGEGREAEV